MTTKKLRGAAILAPIAAAGSYLMFPALALAEEEGGGGLELLIPKMSEFIPTVVSFLIIWVLFAKFAWPAISDMLDKRAENIKDSLASAESARIEAQQLLEEYKAQIADARQESAEIIAEAKRSGEAVRADITAKAQVEADEIVAKARKAIESEKKQALAELQSSVANLSVSVAGKLIGDGFSEEDHRKLVEKYISEVGNLDEN